MIEKEKKDKNEKIRKTRNILIAIGIIVAIILPLALKYYPKLRAGIESPRVQWTLYSEQFWKRGSFDQNRMEKVRFDQNFMEFEFTRLRTGERARFKCVRTDETRNIFSCAYEFVDKRTGKLESGTDRVRLKKINNSLYQGRIDILWKGKKYKDLVVRLRSENS